MFTASYDRKLHLYLVPLPTGETLTAPTRPEAEWAYLQAIAPDVAAKAQRIAATQPALADRVRRAGFIAVEGGVFPCQEPVVYGSHNLSFTCVARIQSQRDPGMAYAILERDHLYYCDCADSQGHTTEDGTEEAKAPATKIAPHTCKHILAFVLSGD